MKRLLTISFGLMVWMSTFAFDFTVDGVNYTKTASGSVEIAALDEYGRKDYEGDFVIPDEVTYDGVTYKVTGLPFLRSCMCLKGSLQKARTICWTERSERYHLRGCNPLPSRPLRSTLPWRIRE